MTSQWHYRRPTGERRYKPAAARCGAVALRPVGQASPCARRGTTGDGPSLQRPGSAQHLVSSALSTWSEATDRQLRVRDCCTHSVTPRSLSMRLILAVLLTASAALTIQMGKNVEFQLDSSNIRTQTFEIDPSRELKEDEVLKVQLAPIGRKGERPSLETPVWLWITARDDRHHWVLPWQPGGGPPQQWLEVLLCHNGRSLELMAETNSSHPLPLRWKVSTENIKLGEKKTTMKSTPADVSYRRFSWDDPQAQVVDLEVVVTQGTQVCASLAVMRRCVTHPHQLTDDHLLQRVLFARSAKLSILRADAPDGFWLYLIPEVDNGKCAATAHLRNSPLPAEAKTIRVSAQSKTFVLPGATTQPEADQLPSGDSAAGTADGDWAQSPLSECQNQLLECHQRCPLT